MRAKLVSRIINHYQRVQYPFLPSARAVDYWLSLDVAALTELERRWAAA
jgi:hypothetical protein